MLPRPPGSDQGSAPRPLLMAVLAVFLVITLLAVLFLGSGQVATDHALTPESTKQEGALSGVIRAGPEPATPAPPERRPAEPLTTGQSDVELRARYVVKVKIQNAAGEYLPGLITKTAWWAELSVVATAVALPGDLPPIEGTSNRWLGVGEWVTNSDRGRNPDDQRGFAGELWLDQDPPVHAALVLRHVVLQRRRIEPGQHELVFTLEAAEVFGLLGSVVFRLVDDATGQPLAKAPVSVCTPNVFATGQVTDDDGRFRSEHFPPGPLTVTSFMKDYESLFRYVRMPPGGRLDLGDIRLSSSIQITASAVDGEGKPVTDAEFQYSNLDDRTFPQPLRDRHVSHVDAGGQARLAVGRHRYVVSVRSQRQGFGHATVDARFGTPAPIVITLRQTVPVALHVHVDKTVGYMVTILDPVRSPVRVLWFGSEHRPEGTALPPGAYTVEIHDSADRLVRSFALMVGTAPVTIDVP
jgi:hypothetical protein